MTSIRHELLRLGIRAGILAAVLWILLTFIAAVRICPVNEMAPSVRDGDLCLFLRIGNPGFNDVVLYKNGEEEHYGRVVAVPQDTVKVDGDGLSVNGAGSFSELPYRTLPQSGVVYPLRLEADEYFVLADLREQALDSRTYGAVGQDSILGRMIFVMRRRGF